MRVCYAGSFDPLTNGHLDIIKRCSKMFDEVIILVNVNINKKCLFNQDERKQMIEKVLASNNLNNCLVECVDGLTVVEAKKRGCNALVRGVRSHVDYAYEMNLEMANHYIDNDMETILLLAKSELSFISSSNVKELLKYGCDIKPLVPQEVYEELMKRK